MENSTNGQGQTALITGASMGIGKELARQCAQNGYNVILVSRTQEDLDAVASDLSSQYGIQATVIAKDLSEPSAAEELYDEVKSKGMQVDVLINDAGAGVYGNFWETELQEELDIIQLNVGALVVLTKLYLKEMVARGSGKILQLASVVSKAPNPMQSVYAGTKAFIYNFTLGVINELKDVPGVTMTALLPGATDTDFFHKAGADGTKIYNETELSDPADVAKDGFEALMSGDSKVISGGKNKFQAFMGNFMSDEMIAEKGAKMNEASGLRPDAG